MCIHAGLHNNRVTGGKGFPILMGLFHRHYSFRRIPLFYYRNVLVSGLIFALLWLGGVRGRENPNLFCPIGSIGVLAACWWHFHGLLLERRPLRVIRILILGTGETARMIAREISTGRCPRYKIVGFLCNPETKNSLVYGYPVLGGYEELGEIIQRQRIDRIVLSLRERRNKLPVEALLKARISGIEVQEGAAFYEGIAGKVLLADLRPSDLIFSDGFRVSGTALIGRRMFEIFVSLFILILTFPLLLVVALIIKLDDPGPILFKQKRVGQNGRIFNLLKLRTMRRDAEIRTGPVWSKVGDSRVTRVGKILRKTRIDEIPQALNVLKGDMSFVGPRPERPHFVELLKGRIPFYFQRLSVKPGITGLAQIRYGYGSSVKDAVEKLQYDLYYIKHMCFWLDFSVIMDTVKVVLFGWGGR